MSTAILAPLCASMFPDSWGYGPGDTEEHTYPHLASAQDRAIRSQIWLEKNEGDSGHRPPPPVKGVSFELSFGC